MPPELHLHPDRLRSHATAAAALSDDLHAIGGAPDPAHPGGDRLHAAVRSAVRELAELSAALTRAASCAERADLEVSRALARPGDGR
jgi:hypothetical protein